MEVFAVVLQSNRFLILSKNWLQDPTEGKHTVRFFCNQSGAAADFSLDQKIYFDSDQPNCYSVYVTKGFRSKQQAEKYTSWKRPIYMKKIYF